MMNIWQHNKKTFTVWLAFLWIAVVLFPSAAYSAADKQVEVYLNGKALAFEDAKPVIQNGRTLVPFRTIFEALGYTVTWDEENQIARGDKDGFLIELPVGSMIATVGGAETPLDVPAQIVDGSTLVPLRFVSEYSGYDVTYTSMPNVFKIGIADEPGISPIPLQPEPWLIVGRVMEEDGEAEPGIPVRAGSTLTSAGQQTGTTDDQGYYYIELPKTEAEWQVEDTYEVEYNGQTFEGELIPDASGAISASAGGVRNMTSVDITGTLHMELAGTIGPDGQALSPEHIVITLSPISPLLDGTEGETIVKRVSILSEGAGITRLPIGQYEITAHYMPPGSDPVPVSLREEGSGSFGDVIQPSFLVDGSGDYMIEIEVIAEPAF